MWMRAQLRQDILVHLQLFQAIVDLLAPVSSIVRVMGDLRAQAVLCLVGQMTMMLVLHQSLQAQSDE
jgi:hypothetical protein